MTLVLRVFADRARAQLHWMQRSAAGGSVPREIALLGARYETRGGFLFPSAWRARWFHGLGYQFSRGSVESEGDAEVGECNECIGRIGCLEGAGA